MLRFADILTSLIDFKGTAPEIFISEAIIDSRRSIPGSLFIALPGEHVNGHRYVADAFNRGSLLALVQEDLSQQFPTIDLRRLPIYVKLQFPQPPFCLLVNDSLKALQTTAKYWRRQLNIRVVGITGSVGKSTTKELVAEVLSQKYHTFKNPGNYNNEIGLPLTILNLGRGCERVVLEMGFYYPGEITFLCDIALPQVGIVTNIGTVHAERAGSQEEIVKGKTELVQALPPAPDGIAILNNDDALVRSMATKTKAKTITYGLHPSADQWADQVSGKGLQGIEFTLHQGEYAQRIQIPLLGKHSVLTALRAIAAGLSEGLSIDEILQGLQQGHTQLRMVAVQIASGALILDDTYNATPESTIAALDLLEEMDGQHIAVLGDMLELGAYEHQGHEQVGKRAAEVLDRLIAVGLRSKTIAETAQKSGLTASAIHWVENSQQAAEILRGLMKNDAVVLIKGSHGMHMDRIMAAMEETI
jgi:UDP-N-acetylmuramoyl-tripeptide--D-alanyl-D-alanine ligase